MELSEESVNRILRVALDDYHKHILREGRDVYEEGSEEWEYFDKLARELRWIMLDRFGYDVEKARGMVNPE